MIDSPNPADDDQFDPLKRNGNTGVMPPGAVNGGLAGPDGPVAPTAPPSPSPSPGQFNRDQFRDTLMGSVHNTGDLSNFVTQHQGDFGAGVKLLPGGKGDKIVLPDGSVIDAVMGAGINGGQGSAWTGAGTMGANGQIIPQAMGAAGTTASGGAPGSDFQNQIRQQLMGILTKSQQPVDENSAEIAQPYAAGKLEAQRGLEQERRDLAERLYGEGDTNSGSLRQGTQQAGERMALGTANLKSQLIGRAVQQKQAQLQQALQLAVQSGDAESARQIQLQIAQMDNQLRQQQLAQQGSQWADQFGLNAGQFQYQKDRDAALYGGQ